MKFQDLPADILSIRIKPTEPSAAALGEEPVLSLEASPIHPGVFAIRLAQAVIDCRPVVKQEVQRLNAELASGRAILAQLANPAKDGSIELQIAWFTGACLELGEVQIGVDEYAQGAIAKIERRKVGVKGEDPCRWLDQHCCFRQGNRAFFFLLAGPAMDAALAPEQPSAGKDPEGLPAPAGEAEPATVLGQARQAAIPQPTRKNSLCIRGEGIRMVATGTPVPGDKTIFIASRLTEHKPGYDRALRLGTGKLSFIDWTQAGAMQFLAQAQMLALTREDGSYLKKWDAFGDLEGEILLGRARAVGTLRLAEVGQIRTLEDGKAGVSCRIAQASEAALEALKKGFVEELEAVVELPTYLTDESLTFAAFVAELEGAPREPKATFKVRDFKPETKAITLVTEGLPEASDPFILSLAGETTQIRRRMDARRMILDGRAANPQLGLLIEEKGQITPTRAVPKVQALTAFVRDKVFRKEPNVQQAKAIEVALNTPDIALIQGPPGTGKTTVIAAIIERLNELADKRGVNLKGQVLLTGFQHDAVENMIGGLTPNGLPVPKFGRRSEAEDDDLTAFEEKLEAWCGKLAADLRARNPQFAEIQQEADLKNSCLQYLQAPTRAWAVTLVGQIEALGVALLGEAGARQAANLHRKLLAGDRLNDEPKERLATLRRLRTRAESFQDDGPERATDALEDLQDGLEPGERALLDRASLWRSEDGTPAFLKELEELKRALLVRFAAPPVFRVEKRDDEVFALAEEAIKRIRSAGYTARDAKSAALAEFLAELEGNPSGMMKAVSEYSFAFAATCQQSVHWRMQEQKKTTGGAARDAQTELEYEYVIVDEAARVSPRDLMVPMAQGKRIILVGDHRQLPHLIDDEVARQMEAGEAGQEEQDWLKKSMFQYLFAERLKKLEEQDGNPRCVTLDTQYRMHPLLGDFISRNFYERFAQGEKFGSGRLASEFAHNLPGMDGKPAAWLEVGADQGQQRRSGTSWTRPAEATAIARQVRTWMQSEAGQGLSFGVISFYKAQAELIKAQLRSLTEDHRKLRIGTVDSFQGMEFDVVLLSMVRTCPAKWKPLADDRQQQGRALFGHLCLYNRLNVAMSRQRKLLVVVGEPEQLQRDLAGECIPGLVDFYRLCQQEGRLLSCH